MPTFDNSFLANHTCLSIKDPKVTIPFYEKNFGFKYVSHLDFPEAKVSLHILSIENEGNAHRSWTAREGILEFCHHYGTEDDDSFSVNNGNGEKHRGFGHICVSVDNIQASEEKLLSQGVEFKKKLSDGRQKNIAFALDPDGYWIELIEHGVKKSSDSTDIKKNKLNHTMVRVKDPKKSIEFYQNVLGFKLFSTMVHENAKFTLYFLGYDHTPDFKENSLSRDAQASKQSVLELTHNWGTESDDKFEGYHDGNSTENGAKAGYGHIGISCKDAGKLCKEIDQEFGDKVSWAVKYDQGPAKGLAFIRDPDQYLVEIFSHDVFDTWVNGRPPQ